MVYAIITGGHFFPFAWFYKTNLYAVFAGIISIGAMTLGLILPVEKMYFIPILMSVSLITPLFYYTLTAKKRNHLTLTDTFIVILNILAILIINGL
jgi:hypothetical protein